MWPFALLFMAQGSSLKLVSFTTEALHVLVPVELVGSPRAGTLLSIQWPVLLLWEQGGTHTDSTRAFLSINSTLLSFVKALDKNGSVLPISTQT